MYLFQTCPMEFYKISLNGDFLDTHVSKSFDSRMNSKNHSSQYLVELF